jgi:hypothetical protein
MKNFHATTVVNLRSSSFWKVARNRLLVTGVSGQDIFPIFNGQAVQKYGCAETPVNNYQSMPCKIPEERRHYVYVN